MIYPVGRDRDILAIQKKRPPAWRGPGQVKPGPLRQLGRASETASRAVMLGSYSRQQPHIGAALMQLQPALLDSAPDAGAELRAACVERVEEGVVDLLDMESGDARITRFGGAVVLCQPTPQQMLSFS